MNYIAVLFKTRNKDNKHLENFKESTAQFLLKDLDEVQEMFNMWLNRRNVGQLGKCYISINEHNGELIQKQLISYLALNELDLSKIEAKTVSIAMLPQCAVTKKWLFDFDYGEESQLMEFIQDIKQIDNTLEVEYKKTVHGYAVVVNHGFDTRELLKKWTECGNKKDGMLLYDWKVKQ